LGSALGSLESSAGQLVEGGVADLCVFDPSARWDVRPQALRSQGRNTPFAGSEVPGRVRFTVVSGHLAHESP
jgi:dihydroorotase